MATERIGNKGIYRILAVLLCAVMVLGGPGTMTVRADAGSPNVSADRIKVFTLNDIENNESGVESRMEILDTVLPEAGERIVNGGDILTWSQVFPPKDPNVYTVSYFYTENGMAKEYSQRDSITYTSEEEAAAVYECALEIAPVSIADSTIPEGAAYWRIVGITYVNPNMQEEDGGWISSIRFQLEYREYSITYQPDDLTDNGNNPAAYTWKDKDYVFMPVSKDGYDFTGWFSDSRCSVQVTKIGDVAPGDITVYAGFKEKKKDDPTPDDPTPDDPTPPDVYSITYVLNGGTNSVLNPYTYKAGTGVSVLHPATKEGYVFTGWYWDEDCTRIVSDTDPISIYDLGDITIYAGFKEPGIYTMLELLLKLRANPPGGNDNPGLAAAVVKLREDSVVYDGKAHTSSVERVVLNGIVLTKDLDYTVVEAEGTDPGDYTVTVQGKGSFINTYATAVFAITPPAYDINDVEIELEYKEVQFQRQNKKSFKPGIKSAVLNGEDVMKWLVIDHYENNIFPGTASVYIKGKDGYFNGTKEVNFTIKEENISVWKTSYTTSVKKGSTSKGTFKVRFYVKNGSNVKYKDLSEFERGYLKEVKINTDENGDGYIQYVLYWPYDKTTKLGKAYTYNFKVQASNKLGKSTLNKSLIVDADGNVGKSARE